MCNMFTAQSSVCRPAGIRNLIRNAPCLRSATDNVSLHHSMKTDKLAGFC